MACALPHLLLFLFLLPFSGVAQTNGGNVSIGASLSAAAEADSWLSQSGDFAFGFKEQGGTNLFLLSIWYDKIPEKTIVWYANGGNTVPRGSRVELTADRGLVLTNPQGDEIWKSDPLVGSVTYGYMNNTGNFVLKDGNLQELWESFRVPTDTMLPTQELEKGYVLTSRKTEANFSKGRFQLGMPNDDNGNLVLRTINLPTDHHNEPYFTSGTRDDNDPSNAGVRFVFNQSGFIYVLRGNGQRSMLSQGGVVSATDNYLRATLDFDGVFAEYYHPKTSNGNESWSVLWSEPENICTASRVFAGSGTCGYNSLCRLNTDGRPSCSCPRGYSLLDPSDQFSGCKPNFAQGCEDDHEQLYDLVELSNTDWPFSDYVLLEPFDKEECRNSCLRDCLCSVSIYRDNQCWKKRIPLSNGRVDRTESSTAFVKVGKDTNSSPPGPCPPDEKKPGKKHDETKVVVGSVLLGSSVFFNFVLVAAILLGFCFIYKRKEETRIPRVESVVDTNLHCFTYQELAQATNGFNEEVGKGAFSVVYKGEMNRGSGNFVAVKKLERLVPQRDKEFKAEVSVIGQTHHKNLVRLIGFCNEGPNRLLVYEYMNNGTLASFLFGDTRPSWNQRIRIAYGIGRGLLYLHEECSTQIIHCDIKSQNILIDDYYNARISDFGMAKLLMIGQSQTHTDIRGTRGYVAPEWFRSIPITVKVDVYSFGVLLLEIICCRRSVDMDTSEAEKEILTDWAYDCYQEGKLDALVEGDLEAMNDRAKLERFVMVAIWCIQEDPSLRPTMRKVTQMLEGVVEVNVPPCPSPFSVTNSIPASIETQY